MRALWVVVVSALIATSGCIFPDDDGCVVDGIKKDMQVPAFPPGAVVSVALAGCSTCDHSRVQALWTPDGFVGEVTGFIEVQLSPHCFVRDNTAMVNPSDGFGMVDNNYKNCGPVIDYDAYVTNRSNQQIGTMTLELYCPAQL